MTIPRRTFLTRSLALAASSSALAPASRAEPSSHLTPYDSEAQLRQALERWKQRSQRQVAERREASGLGNLGAEAAKSMAAPAAPAALAQAAADSITNVQSAGVDESGSSSPVAHSVCGRHHDLRRSRCLPRIPVGRSAADTTTSGGRIVCRKPMDG